MRTNYTEIGTRSGQHSRPDPARGSPHAKDLMELRREQKVLRKRVALPQDGDSATSWTQN